LKVELRRPAPTAQNPVGRGITIRHLIDGEIGQRQRSLVERGLDLAKLEVERPHLLARHLQLLHQVVGRLSCPLSTRHFVTGGVPFGLEGFDSREELPPAAVELEHGIDGRYQRLIAPAEQAGTRPLRIVSESLDVDHASVVG
jgi:hypothetical protein